MMCMQSLTLGGCFSHSLVEVESFIVLTQKNLILRGGPTSMICNITISLAVNPGPLICIHKCKTQASSEYTLRMEFTLQKRYLLGSKLLKLHIFA